MSIDTFHKNILSVGSELKFLGIPEVLNTLIIDYTLDLFEFFKYYYSKYFSIRKEGSTFKEHIRHSFLSVLKDILRKNMSFEINIDGVILEKGFIISDVILDNDNVRVIITHRDSIVVYLTDNNWYEYECYFSYYKCKNILFCGPVSYIGNNWCYRIHAESVDFFGLNMLRQVGSRWLYECPNLESINLNGLSRLTKILHEWLSNSNKLTIIDFDGLTKLRIVGKGWLYNGGFVYRFI